MSLLYLFVALVVSFAICLLLVRFAHKHSHFTGDNKFSETQKFHDSPVPRVGGLALVAAFLAVQPFVLLLEGEALARVSALVFFSCLPVFLGGLLEDILKVGLVKTRLAAMAAGVLLLIYLLDWRVVRVDFPWVSNWLALEPISIALTLIAIVGVINAMNLIDGYNGLASAVGMIILASLAYIGLKVGDRQITTLAVTLLGACAGFMFWNWPRGLIFLGDGGAYVIGFGIASLSVGLVMRNPNVSAWYAVVLLLYPIVETIFTINRRLHRQASPGLPDAAHLHQLVYKRMMRWAVGSGKSVDRKMRNSMTSPYLWLISSLSVIPASIWWNNQLALQTTAVLFVLGYLWLYRSITKFRTPKWLIYRKHNIDEKDVH
ncbi:glycosyl transferase [Chitiniphilus shinanonensis]|uniref:Glycosyl transferase n=1 Tax=Chitiniphilus shinanonensis TaxID=553088 RepID=A0ABQ6BVM9_9NEIS|nr:glycosyltransferase [Chitiniphilus shinanonensis]GLS03819.1 glycosyl transferase [Chitiniphilus shinanonensis]